MDKTPEPVQESVKLKVKTPPHKYVNVCLEDQANPISKLFFLWTNKMINYGRKNAFQEDDLFEIRKDQKFAHSRDNFAKHYNKKGAKSYRSVGKSMLAVIRTPLFVASLLLIISNLLQFAGPLLLKEILKYMAVPTIPDWKGWVYASGMFAAFLIKAIMNQQGMHHVISMSLKNLVSPQSAIFEKILNIKATARGYVDTGKIVNLATVDCLGIFRFSTMASYVITAPFIIVAAMALIINEVGASGVVGLGVIVVGTFITGIANVKTVGIRFASLRFSDQRSKAIAEYISGIRVIKYYGWENFAFKKINPWGSWENFSDIVF